jgi:hypothetical protein
LGLKNTTGMQTHREAVLANEQTYAHLTQRGGAVAVQLSGKQGTERDARLREPQQAELKREPRCWSLDVAAAGAVRFEYLYGLNAKLDLRSCAN